MKEEARCGSAPFDNPNKWASAGDFLGGDGGEYRLGIYGTGELPVAVKY